MAATGRTEHPPQAFQHVRIAIQNEDALQVLLADLRMPRVDEIGLLQCHQAITEAQKATAAGTTVYAVAYGAESSGCTTDSPAITQTMEQIASTPETLFSDYQATGGSSSCISAARPTSDLNEILREIGEDLAVARLIPDGST